MHERSISILNKFQFPMLFRNSIHCALQFSHPTFNYDRGFFKVPSLLLTSEIQLKKELRVHLVSFCQLGSRHSFSILVHISPTWRNHNSNYMVILCFLNTMKANTGKTSIQRNWNSSFKNLTWGLDNVYSLSREADNNLQACRVLAFKLRQELPIVKFTLWYIDI